MKMALMFLILNSMFACSPAESVEPAQVNPETEKPQQSQKIKIILGDVPDSVRVDDKIDFDFYIEGSSENLFMTIDTIIPTYKISNWIDWEKVPEDASQIPQEAMIEIINRGITLQMDGSDLLPAFPVKPGKVYKVSFENPMAVGNYKIIFKVKKKSAEVCRKEVTLKVFSPDIDIRVFKVDPWLQLEIWDKNFFEELNKKYTYQSKVFQGKETDTLYSYQQPKPGYPGELTLPGIGVTVYVGQVNGTYFSYQTDETNINSGFAVNWDNDVIHAARTLPQKYGLHCFEFSSWNKALPGNYKVILKITDQWGKRAEKEVNLQAIAYK